MPVHRIANTIASAKCSRPRPVRPVKYITGNNTADGTENHKCSRSCLLLLVVKVTEYAGIDDSNEEFQSEHGRQGADEEKEVNPTVQPSPAGRQCD